MGYSKIKVISPTKVKAIHELGSDGKAHAEDVTVESEVPGRLDYLASQDGKVGVFTFGFSPVAGDHSSLKFPDETDE